MLKAPSPQAGPLLVVIPLLSYEIAPGSDKIDKPLVVYKFFGKHYDIHNNVAYIMTKL